MRLALTLVVLLLLLPAATVAREPRPEPPSLDKEGSATEAGRIARIGQEVAREMLFRAHHIRITEAEVGAEIDRAMIENGSDPDYPSFTTIVASADDSAIPHGNYTNNDEQVIRPGMAVVVDLGARVDNWVSDHTRTYFIGEPTEQMREVYTIVKDAQQLARDILLPFAEPAELDRVARDHITEEGYGDYFIHSLGHGSGQCVHERPFLNQREFDPGRFAEDPAVPGTYCGDVITQVRLGEFDQILPTDVLTIEPGIYLEAGEETGLDVGFGVRLEDLYYVTTMGHILLTSTDSDLDNWAIIHDDDYEVLPEWQVREEESGGVSPFLLGTGIVLVLATLGLMTFILYRRQPS